MVYSVGRLVGRSTGRGYDLLFASRMGFESVSVSSVVQGCDACRLVMGSVS